MGRTTATGALIPHKHPLLTTEGRAAQPFARRVRAALVTVVVLHVVGLGLLGYGTASGVVGGVTLAAAAFAYARGLVHSFDLDHICMIDNSIRKFVAEGRDPASVGLAFSLGHSSVVVATGALVIGGAGFVGVALDASSGLARLLSMIGLAVSGVYLLLAAVANLATFLQALRLRRALRAEPGLVLPLDALNPRGPAARLMAAPLRRVRHPRHVYLVGVLFSLGFDTSSQIGLLMVTAGAALAGAPPLSLLCLPFLFTAAMTLGDTFNGLLMLRLYRSAVADPARRIGYNLLVTGVSVASGLLVGVVALSSLLSEVLGRRPALLETLAAADTNQTGWWLAAFFALVGLGAVVLERQSRDGRSA